MSSNFSPDSCPDNRFECIIANYMKKFLRLLHVVFGFALVITVVMTLVIFATDIYHIFTKNNLANGTIHALGTLLILWTLAELLSSEIRHLRGEKIKVTIFIEVAIAAFVRKLLITSTEGISLQDASVYIISLLILGIVYWLLQSRQYSE